MIELKDIIYRWSPSRKQVLESDDCADEYIIVSNEKAIGGIIVYARYGKELNPNPFNCRYLIKHLIGKINKPDYKLAIKNYIEQQQKK